MENTLRGDQGDYVLAMEHLKLGNEELINNWQNIEESDCVHISCIIATNGWLKL